MTARECIRCGSGGGPQPCVDERGLCCLCQKNVGREFVGEDGHDWHVTRWPSASCGANYADVERVDGTKRSVRQAELLRRAGIELPEASE